MNPPRAAELERARARAVRRLLPWVVVSDVLAAALAFTATRSVRAAVAVLVVGAVFALFGLAFARERGVDETRPGGRTDRGR